MKKNVIILLLISTAFMFGVVLVKSISLKQNCTGYLKRAADANTIEIAKEQLGLSISYLEANDLTTGYTSVLWKTPDEDIGFWFNNLKASQNELSKVDSTTSSLEKSNLLMKLRETLIDNDKYGDKLTVPDGLSRYPNNMLFGILIWVGGFIAFGFISWLSVEISD